MKYPLHLQKLMNVIRKLPGVGSKTAERYVFHMLSWQEGELKEMSKLVGDLFLHLGSCSVCGTLMDKTECNFCKDESRNQSVIAVVASQKQVYALEETGTYDGLYHVMGGVFSPLDGMKPEALTLEKLKSRVAGDNIKEIIIAFDATLESDATALFIKDQLREFSVKISRLGYGIPVGSSLEYLDGGTLAQSLKNRSYF
ncbi:MAG: recombination mediator RecR [Chlamydiales bacterium]|nr:recombination mediator RecR [Chlamydiales bacterium]